MGILLFLLVVIVVLALVMWAIYYVPMPPGSPVWIKNFLYVLILIVAIVAIVVRLGGYNAALW